MAIGRYAIITMWAAAAALSPARAAESCAAQVARVGASWDAYGFAEPAKPSQAVVYGRSGARIAGIDYRSGASAIREAKLACARGDSARSGRLAGLAAEITRTHAGPGSEAPTRTASVPANPDAR